MRARCRLKLARFAFEQTERKKHGALAELAEFPASPFDSRQTLESALDAFAGLAELLLTKDGNFFEKVDKRHGVPSGPQARKDSPCRVHTRAESVDGLESALAAVRDLPPLHYADADWEIVRASFTLLRRAAAELKVVSLKQAR